MNRRIVYTRPDGGTSIVTPCRNVNEGHLNDDQIFQRSWEKLPEDAIEPRIVFAENVPEDRTFRNAWEHDREKIVVNMDKARNIHLERIRTARDAKLRELDVETMKAIGKGDNGARDAVEVRKQVLRDLPQTIDLKKAKTTEELKALWPAELL